MAKSRASGAARTVDDKIRSLQRNNIIKDVSKLKKGDYVSIGGGGNYPVIYNGYVESVGSKTISLRTQSRMYGEQTIRLPKNLYKAHFDSSTAKELDRLINKK